MQHDLFAPRPLQPTLEGATCDRCGQHVQLYERRLRRAWAAVLLDLYQHDEAHPGAYKLLDNAHATGAAAARDWSLLRYWLLTERHPEKAGWWRITESGRAFVAENTAIPATALIYNGKLYGFGAERVTFDDVQATARAVPSRRRAA